MDFDIGPTRLPSASHNVFWLLKADPIMACMQKVACARVQIGNTLHPLRFLFSIVRLGMREN